MKMASARHEGKRLCWKDDEYEITARRAFVSFVTSDLAWGGNVTIESTGEIHTSTKILSKTDTVTYRGTAEELKPFYEFIFLYLRFNIHNKEGYLPQEIKDEIMENVMTVTKGIALWLTSVGGLLSSTPVCKLSVVGMILINYQDKEEYVNSMMKELKYYSLTDLLEVFLMIHYDGYSVEDALELLNTTQAA